MLEAPKNSNVDKQIDIQLIVAYQNNIPSLILRKHISDPELMKVLISCAFRDIPVYIFPSFKNRIFAINSLLEKGLIYKENNQYFFTF